MLHQLYNMPREQPFILACSGGVDSMAVADFYKRGGKNFQLAYFHHGTPNADAMRQVVIEWGESNDIVVNIGHIKNEKPAGVSPEAYWRNERYAYLFSLSRPSLSQPVVTCHHLNDVAETFLFGAMHGQTKLIAPSKGDALYRPFLTNTKQDLINWCVKHGVKWFEDPSNQDVTVPRNRIRHNMLPEVLKVNPGFLKVLKKKYL